MGVDLSQCDESSDKQNKRKKFLTVGIVWATLAVDVLFFGALTPLLPKYVTELGLQQPVSNLTENGNVTQNLTTNQCNTRASAISTNSILVGVLVALQQWAQVISNLFVGPLVDKIGYDVPMFVGYLVVVGASLGFSAATSLTSLFVCRAAHGVGSSLLKTSGLAVVADIFRDDHNQRARMIGIVMCGLSVGLVGGPPFGSVMYQIGGKPAPFVTIAAMVFAVGLLQLCTRKLKFGGYQTPDKKPGCNAQLKLIKDPYVLITVLLMVLSGLGLGFLEGALPLHMLTSMCPESWMLGTVFLPLNLAFAISVPILGWLNERVGKWIVTFLSFIFAAGGAIGYGYARSFVELLAPGVPMGIATAVTPATIFPIMTYIVDTRIGKSVYGSAFGLSNAAVSLAFGTAPMLGGILVPVVQFRGLMYVSAGLSIVALLPAAFLRKPLLAPPLKEEKTELVEKKEDRKQNDEKTELLMKNVERSQAIR